MKITSKEIVTNRFNMATKEAIVIKALKNDREQPSIRWPYLLCVMIGFMVVQVTLKVFFGGFLQRLENINFSPIYFMPFIWSPLIIFTKSVIPKLIYFFAMIFIMYQETKGTELMGRICRIFSRPTNVAQENHH